MAFDFKRIDEFLSSLDRAKNDDELRSMFSQFQVAYDLGVPSDPYSEAYRKHQFNLYEKLAGRPYAPVNEVSQFDVASAAVAPFPYCHGSCETVGNHLIAIGFVIKALALPPGARILEFGPGWGNITIALAKMGFDVTAVDIEKNFCELILERARREGVKVHVVNSNFSYIETLSDPYDAVLFFESFHHAADHLALISAFNKVVKPGGRVCFGAEPITPDFPVPWGLRMDGESIWAIRKNGWLELGYNEEYFKNTMEKHGWRLTWHKGTDSPWASAIIAQRKEDLKREYLASSQFLKSQVGILNNAGTFVANGSSGFLIYGPYVTLPAGRYYAEIILDRTVPPSGTGRIDVTANYGTLTLAEKSLRFYDLGEKEHYVIEFSAKDQVSAVEIRIFCYEKAMLGVNALRLTAI